MLLDNSTVSRKCPLCNDVDIIKIEAIAKNNPLYSSMEIELKHHRELWKCNVCESGFIQNIIDESTSEEIYTKSDSNRRWNDDSIFRETKTENVLLTLNHYLTNASTLLDIGSNTGGLLDHAKSFGCVTYGIEYSKSAKAIAMSKGHNMVEYENIEGAKKFDIITAFDVVEHLYDVNGFLDLCYGALSKNGKLILLTGNINSLPAKLCKGKWWYLSAAEHIIFPSKKFFSGLRGWKLSKWKACYNSKSFICSRWQLMKYTLLPIIKKTYSAYFSFMPDHVLIVLEKN